MLEGGLTCTLLSGSSCDQDGAAHIVSANPITQNQKMICLKLSARLRILRLKEGMAIRSTLEFERDVSTESVHSALPLLRPDTPKSRPAENQARA